MDNITIHVILWIHMYISIGEKGGGGRDLDWLEQTLHNIDEDGNNCFS